MQPLVKENTEYIWLPHHTHAFEKTKDAISQDSLLQFYDVSKPLFIECDASKKGLGCISSIQPVSEMDEKNIVNTSYMNDFLSDLKPLAYASKSLSDTETHYANIERELLGVVFGVEHFKHLTYGTTHIITDHKPLLPLFDKSLTNTTPHLSRLLLHISEYDLKLHYQPGSKMKLSDALSRQSSHNTKDGNNTEVKGLDISIHALEADVTDQ